MLNRTGKESAGSARILRMMPRGRGRTAGRRAALIFIPRPVHGHRQREKGFCGQGHVPDDPALPG